jgi:hypothetical protein
MAWLGARLAIDEEETQAQNKVQFGMFLMLIYPHRICGDVGIFMVYSYWRHPFRHTRLAIRRLS